MSSFQPATRAWFESAFEAPTEVQARGWPLIAGGSHVLLCAPTGSGKTLAAFLSCIDRLAGIPRDQRSGTRVVYVSPLKALVYDIDRNLRAPLAGIARAAARAGEPVDLPRVAVRTGDTAARERRHQLRAPGDILVTTPESLYLMLGSAARETLREVDTVIVDEVHALAPTKRGAHLALSLERLAALGDGDPQRIGLSATANPLETVAGFLGGDRPVEIVDASRPPDLDLRVVAAAADMTRPEETAFVRPEAPEPIDADPDEPPSEQTEDTGMWAAILPALVAEITAHRQTIVFVNSRALAERLTQRICEIAGEPIARAHHGSLAHAERRVIEEQLKSGSLPAIVATSSLELGIDMGAVDLVLLVEAPKSTASGLQRIGRAGHAVGETSVGRLFPKHRGDLLEAAAVAAEMAAGRIEAIAVPKNPLDVLAQHAVAAVGAEPREVGALGRLFRRAANFRELPESAYLGVLDMLAGRYPSASFSDLRARIDWDRAADTLTARRGSKMLAIIGGGTIPDRGLYRVVLGDGGPRLGELDEEMVNETTPGQTITLGASTWRVTEITRDKVVVTPAPGEIGTLPFWRGEGPGRPLELGRALGALVRRIEEHFATGDGDAALEMLARDHLCDAAAAENLLDYLSEQAAESALPTDRRIVIERFRDELGDYRVCVLSPFGARVHAPWALALEASLSAQTGLVIQTMWSDDGIVLRFLDGDAMPEAADLLPDPDDVERLIVDQLAASSLFASQFRENAARSLLLPRRRPGERTPLWLQRLKSQQLLAIAREFPAFPIIMETYRSCLQDVFDTGALIELLRGIRSREIAVAEVETAGPSPMARSLVFAYVAAYLYEGDAPLAERRAQALALDRDLLRELLGGDKLRELLDPEVIAATEASMLGRGRIETAGQLLDLLRRVGDLDTGELAAAAAGDVDVESLLDELALARQVCPVRLGDGATHHIALEDVGLYRDALGCVPPPATPAAFLEPVDTPLDDLLIRFLRNRGPLSADEIADRYQLPARQTSAVLARLAAAGQLVAGGFRRGRSGTEYCHPEVLRRIKRDTLAILRGQVAPVDPVVLGRFLPEWHGVAGKRGRGVRRLEEVVAQLEGLPMSFEELESVILPSRVADYAPAMLDELGAIGQLVWVGRGASGPRDGRVALYRREHAAALLAPPDLDALDAIGELHRAILTCLEQRGASFFVAIKSACEPADTDEVIEALWDLVWLGAITNDTFGPLRARGRRKPTTTRGRARRVGQVAGGRWSLVAELCDPSFDATRAAHRRAVTLLERHGVVCRESVAIEDLAGGFSALYPVFREMEDSGRVRRGYFVDGLGGAQFTLPGAVDRLRAAAAKPSRDVLVLAATDPANPYGWLVPWPASPADSGARRAVGAHVILRGGEPVLFVDRGGKRMVTFPAAGDPEIAAAAAAALEQVARRQRRRSLRIATIDGQRARTAALADVLLAAGFYADASGLALDVRGSSI